MSSEQEKHPFEVVLTHHVGITVANLDRAIALFTELLGYELISRADRDPAMIEKVTGVPGADIEVAYVRRNDSVVELLCYSAPDNRSRIDARPCDTGHSHLAYDVTGIESFVEAAKEYGLQPASPPVVNPSGPNGGALVVYLRNEDLTIELIQRP